MTSKSTPEFAISTYGNSDLPVLVLLHGFLGSKQDWLPYILHWKQYFYCVAVDLPGHGESLWESNNFVNLNSFNSVVDAVVMGVSRYSQKFSLLGYSMGGRIALGIAARFPQYLEKLVLISPDPGLSDDKAKQTRAKHDAQLLLQVQDSHSWQLFLQEWYRQKLFADVTKNPKFPELLNTRLQGNPKELQLGINLMSVSQQPNFWPDIPQLSMPILYIAGEKDSKYHEIGNRFVELCKNCQLFVFPNASHMAHWENPQPFSKLVQRFIENEL